MVCMMHRGMRPWFLAKIIACSRVTFWVHLRRTKEQKGESNVENAHACNPDKEVVLHFEIYLLINLFIFVHTNQIILR